jgi:hypothetical protein
MTGKTNYLAGAYYSSPDELWKEENIKPESNVKDLISKLGKTQITKPIPPAPPAPVPTPPMTPMTTSKPIYLDTNVETKDPKPTLSPKIYYTPKPVLFHQLYEYAMNYIPIYYSYERHKRLEEAVKMAIIRGLTMNRSELEIELLIKNIIDKGELSNITNIIIENPHKKNSIKKSSNKTSNKQSNDSSNKSTKSIKKDSKKTSKTIKKASKKISKKNKTSKSSKKSKSKKTSKKT